jgi:uncharacterized protein YdhG (YjbR/CyaY superfamily)
MPKRPEVEQWLAVYDRPLKPLLLALRDIILAADARIDECIKWQTPTFIFNGNLASFNPRSKKHVSLMFHVGAMIPGAHPKLEGTGDTARFMSFPDLAAVQSAKRDLVRVVRAWCDWQDARTPRAVQEASLKKVAARRRPTSRRQAVAAKHATKPVARPTAKPVAKPTARPAARPAAKPVAKKPARPAAKKPVARPAAKKAAAKKPAPRTTRSAARNA